MRKNSPTKTDYLKYFNGNKVENPNALTLTLKQRMGSRDFVGRCSPKIDPEVASQNTRHFLNRLNQEIYGHAFRRFNKQLSVIPVMEGDDFTRLHVHMALQRPGRIGQKEFESLVSACWLKTSYGYRDIKIDPVHNYSGWINYMLKNRSKSEDVHSAIDWVNVFLH